MNSCWPDTAEDLVILAVQRYLAQGGEAAWHWWSEQPGAMGGWRPHASELTPISYRRCLAILERYRPNGTIMIQALERPTLAGGMRPQASEGPPEGACSGSFCEIADRHDKGGMAA